MAGIVSCGAYIPLWRLSRGSVTKGLPGEKAVAGFDEDSITMALAAAIDCLNGIDRRSIDGLFFASTTSPYKEKQGSTIVAAAADFRRDILTADFANSLRVATVAMKLALNAVDAGSAKLVMITAVDCRLGAPGSDFEQSFGDGAAAILVGGSNVIAEVEANYSVSDEIMDIWRTDTDAFVRSAEDRFIYTQGYHKVVREVVSELTRRCNLAPKDFAKVVLYGPDARWQLELARSLGFDPKTQLQNSFLASVGNTGAACLMMGLVGALEEAKAGDRILLANYGDGSDAFVLRVTDEVNNLRNRGGIKKHIQRKRMIPDYDTYLQWKGLLRKEMGRSSPQPPSASGLWRERDKNLRLHGAKCRECGAVQYPPQRVCYKCQTKDHFDAIRLADKKGEVFTYSLENRGGALETPSVVAVVNFEVGGRMLCLMTDHDLSEVRVGLPVEMTFRRLFSTAGIHNYFWKCRPRR